VKELKDENMSIEKLIEKYESKITDTCSCCGHIESAAWLECGCEERASSKLSEQVVRDLKSLLDSENKIG